MDKFKQIRNRSIGFVLKIIVMWYAYVLIFALTRLGLSLFHFSNGQQWAILCLAAVGGSYLTASLIKERWGTD